MLSSSSSAFRGPSVWRSVILMVLAIVLGGLAGGCDGEREGPSYADAITQERMTRDMEMRSDRSVIPPRQRDSFRGLQYFAIDTTYRYTVPLNRRPRSDTILIAESTGGVAPQVRVGTVVVPFPPRPDTLEVFRVMEGESRGQLWIPFTDATNGQQTYAMGRYVDLEPVEADTGPPGSAPDSVRVDFNKAYNPTCTYDPTYACPIPPDENALPFPVPAGEQKPLL